MSYEDRLAKLEIRLGYKFKERAWLTRALTHSSYGDGRRKVADYERLEFLGDRVLGLLTAETLFLKSPDKEGGLAIKLNALVRKETCADVARELNVGPLLMMSKSTERLDGREKVSILGDAAESIFGAIYLDGGFEEARSFYQKYWHDRVLDVLLNTVKDPKTELQERSASGKFEPPIYSVVGQSGPDHRPLFKVEVTVNGKGQGQGEGANKKEAERLAAADLLENWGVS